MKMSKPNYQNFRDLLSVIHEESENDTRTEQVPCSMLTFLHSHPPYSSEPGCTRQCCQYHQSQTGPERSPISHHQSLWWGFVDKRRLVCHRCGDYCHNSHPQRWPELRNNVEYRSRKCLVMRREAVRDYQVRNGEDDYVWLLENRYPGLGIITTTIYSRGPTVWRAWPKQGGPQSTEPPRPSQVDYGHEQGSYGTNGRRYNDEELIRHAMNDESSHIIDNEIEENAM